MNNWKKLGFFFASMLYAAVSFSCQGMLHSPVGAWQTIDDVTGKPKAIVALTQTSTGALTGRIVKVFETPGEKTETICQACSGPQHNQPIVGLVFLNDLKQDAQKSNLWSGGTILDPKNGKVYSCNLKLSGDGRELKVRGYIGFPALGRNQTWERV